MTSYDGGKGGSGVYQWIINQIPPHRRFVSLFLGNCAVMRHKRPSDVSIGIEIDEAVIEEYWRGVPGVTILPGDAFDRLGRLDLRSDDFVYCDPPYLLSTRSQQRPLYQYEFSTIEQHRVLLSALRKLPCMVAISGYWSALYEMELSDWRSSTFWTNDRAGNRREEWLWMNYPEPLELHDYRYLGSNFRERERIKRKKQRWIARLRKMGTLERYSLMEAIGELKSCTGGSDEGAGGIATDSDIDEHLVTPPAAAMAAGSTRSDDGARAAYTRNGDAS